VKKKDAYQFGIFNIFLQSSSTSIRLFLFPQIQFNCVCFCSNNKKTSVKDVMFLIMGCLLKILTNPKLVCPAFNQRAFKIWDNHLFRSPLFEYLTSFSYTFLYSAVCPYIWGGRQLLHSSHRWLLLPCSSELSAAKHNSSQAREAHVK